MKKNYITASEFDEKFDQGEDMTEFLDMENASKPGHPSNSVTVDFPEWMAKDLERISHQRGVSREEIIKLFIAQKLKEGKE